MTKLEQEMYQALRNAEKEGRYMNEVAAEVAKKYIIAAWKAGGERAIFNGYPGVEDAPTLSEWCKENGIVK